MSFLTRLLTEKFIEEPNRKKRAAIFEEALGSAPVDVQSTMRSANTFDEQGSPIFGAPSYSERVEPGTGLLADIYNPTNQARFASEMMRAPGGDTIANAMTSQIQRGGQTLDTMQFENDRQDNIVADANALLYGAPQRSVSNIPRPNTRLPVGPSLSPVAGTSQPPSILDRGKNNALLSPEIKPTGTAADFDTYNKIRQQMNAVANHPLLKDSMKPALDALDAKWGYGKGAPNSVQEWRNAQRFDQYPGSFEDWKKMSRQTIMKGDPAKVGDLQKLMFPPGSPGYSKYGTSSIPYGIAPEELANLGAVLRDDLSAEGAGKYTMLKTAQEQFPVIEKTAFSSPGVFDSKTLWEMVALDFTDLASFGVSSKAQQAHTAFETGMQGITRTETGAAMRDEEIANTKRRFMPKPWSSNETNMLRWSAFQYFIDNATDIINPAAKENKGLQPNEIMDKAVTKTLQQFGVQKDEVNPPKELKPLLDKAKSEDMTYTGHDDQYIYGVDEDGRKSRVKR